MFFVDRCLGSKVVPDALHNAGYAVEVHSQHFEQDETDDKWIKAVGKKGWIILTKDRHVKSNQIEIEALMSAGVPTFTLMSADTTGEENAAAFLTAMPDILRFVEKSALSENRPLGG